jgi:hypothetical protein
LFSSSLRLGDKTTTSQSIQLSAAGKKITKRENLGIWEFGNLGI